MLKQFVVIGLGRFGRSVALSLTSRGHQVLAVDKSETEVDKIVDYVSEAVRADAMDEDFLRDIDITAYDAVIVGMATNMEASILVCMLLRDLGVKNIVAKAHSRLHGEVLEKIGVNRIIYPEWDMGERVARMLTSSHKLLDFIELSPDHSIIEMVAPDKYVGKSLAELDLRVEKGLSVMAIKRGDQVIVGPGGDTEFQAGDILVAVGPNDFFPEE